MEEFYLVKAREYKVQDGDSLDNIAVNAGITWQELAKFNWGTDKPKEINKMLQARVGCTSRTTDGLNYIFTSQDDPGIIYIPEDAAPQSLPVNQIKNVSIKRPKIFVKISLQTNDILGQKMGNVNLVLKSMDGWPDINITTNADGFGKQDKALLGSYKIFVDGDKPVYFLSDTKRPAINTVATSSRYGKLEEATLHTDFSQSSVTRVIVLTGKEKDVIARTNVLGRSVPIPAAEITVKDEQEHTTQKVQIYATDNLALTAGWKNDNFDSFDGKELIRNIIPSWIADYYPEVAAKGYHLGVIHAFRSEIVFYTKQGEIEERFDFTKEFKLTAGIGIYAAFEINKDSYFLDMASQSFSISTGKQGEFSISDIIWPSQKSKYITMANNHKNEVELAFYLPTSDHLAAIAILGGTGRLEDYGTNGTVRKSIHKRNLAVLKNIKLVYNYYIDNVYIPQVRKTLSEDELRALGPPRTYYQMPIPVGANDEELTELFDEMQVSELKPWKVIANMLDEFAKRHSAGEFFLRTKVKLPAKAESIGDGSFERKGVRVAKAGVKLEYSIEYNFDVEMGENGLRTITKSKTTEKITLTSEGTIKKLSPNGFPVEVGYSENVDDINDSYFSLRIAMLQIQAPIGSNSTKFKVELKDVVPGVSAESSFDIKGAEMYVGVNFSLRDLMRKAEGSDGFKKWIKQNYGTDLENARKIHPGLNSILTSLESVEFGVGIGFSGLTEETALAVITSGHGFFDRKSIDDLCDTLWNKLALWEQADLFKLGWNMDLWDNKYYADYKDKLPKSLQKGRFELGADEKIAIVDLGFHLYEDYGKQVNHKIKNSEIRP
jgi:hypothetical protein